MKDVIMHLRRDMEAGPTSSEIVPYKPQEIARPRRPEAPPVVQAAGGNGRFAYDEFFSGIDSPHNERACRNAVDRFLAWYEERGLALNQVRPAHGGDYINTLAKEDGEPASTGRPREQSRASRELHGAQFPRAGWPPASTAIVHPRLRADRSTGR